MKNLLVEGWRNINHSYSMVNQYQLIELLNHDFKINHTDLPYGNPNWNIHNNNSGFDEKAIDLINNFPPPSEGSQFDITYRISFPYRYSDSESSKLFVFGTSEFQNIDGMVFEGNLKAGLENKKLTIITPSNWSRVGFLKAGFEENRVVVIPHGVDTKKFKPLNDDLRRKIRSDLKLNNEDYILLSIGAMGENKGIDLLIVAFANLKPKYSHIKLILKDSSNLYGIKGSTFISELQKSNPSLMTNDVLNSIMLISNNFSLKNLAELYGISDCYVSPYRAEGFNLTPLEASACGLPIIVTKGGATDDYFHGSFGSQIDGDKVTNSSNQTFIEPSLESLITELSNMIQGRITNINKSEAMAYIEQKFTWKAVTSRLVKEFNN
jgi:glycosyltransferase involved in cell wall biosynthesis